MKQMNQLPSKTVMTIITTTALSILGPYKLCTTFFEHKVATQWRKAHVQDDSSHMNTLKDTKSISIG